MRLIKKKEDICLHFSENIYESSKADVMEIDDALESAKSLGNTQIVILVATVLMNIETALTMLGNVFLAKNPPYHCSNHSGFSLNESVPFVEGAYATCLEYSNPGVSNETRECSSWEFDTDISGKSIVSEVSISFEYLS